MEDRPLSFRDQVKDPAAHREYVLNNRFPLALLLDRLQDARNLGSLFRLADAGRLAGIYGYQMSDLLAHKRIPKLSRNTEGLVQFHALHQLEDIKQLKARFQVVALEITEKSIPYTTFRPTAPTLLVLGNEQRGISEEVLQLADHTIHIPMYGFNFSMNVAVSAGIAVFKLLEHLAPA
ncbi:MAG: TrmH family RNA methyltransferase [Bacteroidota bacterium]